MSPKIPALLLIVHTYLPETRAQLSMSCTSELRSATNIYSVAVFKGNTVMGTVENLGQEDRISIRFVPQFETASSSLADIDAPNNLVSIKLAQAGDFLIVLWEVQSGTPFANILSAQIFDSNFKPHGERIQFPEGARIRASGNGNGALLLVETAEDVNPPTIGYVSLNAIRLGPSADMLDSSPLIVARSQAPLTADVVAGVSGYCITYEITTPDNLDPGIKVAFLPNATNSLLKANLYRNGFGGLVSSVGGDNFVSFFYEVTNNAVGISAATINTNSAARIDHFITPGASLRDPLCTSSNVLIWTDTNLTTQALLYDFGRGSAQIFPLHLANIAAADISRDNLGFTFLFNSADDSGVSFVALNFENRDYLCHPRLENGSFLFELYGSAGNHVVQSYLPDVGWTILKQVDNITSTTVSLGNRESAFSLFRSRTLPQGQNRDERH